MSESNKSILSIVRFSAVCDIDDDYYIDSSAVDHFSLLRDHEEGAEGVKRRSVVRGGRSSKRFFLGGRGQATPGHAILRPVRRHQRTRRNRRKGRRIHIRYSEFVDLSDGTTLPIRNDRGGNCLQTDSGESILGYVRDYLDQLEKDCCPTRPQWVVERLRRIHGVEIDSSSVHAALQKPRRIELGSRLVQHLE